MTPAVRVHREEVVERDGVLTAAATVETPIAPRRRYWFRLRLPEGWRLSDSSDPFLPVSLYDAMRLRLPLRVEGDASPSLLANLEEFQRFWARWHPRRFGQVEIVAERERESAPGSPGAVAAFSGGVDSCFTAFRHAAGLAGRQTQELRAGVFAHGFDIPLEEQEGFDAAAERAEAMLATLGVPLVRVATNVRHVEHAWDDAVGAAVASLLLLLQPNARVGLVPSSLPPHLQALWGSHPTSDPLLSTAAFRIVHDGQTYARPEKLRAIAAWPAALEGLRVCYHSSHRDRNCGRCGKCVRTILAFRALGLPLPPCFERDATNADVRRQTRLVGATRPILRMVLDTAEQAGIDERWVRAARRVWRRNRLRDEAAVLVGFLRRRGARR
jgi:hypothetical protein